MITISSVSLSSRFAWSPQYHEWQIAPSFNPVPNRIQFFNFLQMKNTTAIFISTLVVTIKSSEMIHGFVIHNSSVHNWKSINKLSYSSLCQGLASFLTLCYLCAWFGFITKTRSSSLTFEVCFIYLLILVLAASEKWFF
jgi:hypothetical protein